MFNPDTHTNTFIEGWPVPHCTSLYNLVESFKALNFSFDMLLLFHFQCYIYKDYSILQKM